MLYADGSVRPPNVPEAATLVRGDGETFADLEEWVKAHHAKPGRFTWPRGQFQFVIFRPIGMLTGVHPRALSVKRPGSRNGRCYCFTDNDPLPPVWVWTTDDERRAVNR